MKHTNGRKLEKLQNLFIEIGEMSPGRLKCIRVISGRKLVLDRNLLGGSTHDYYQGSILRGWPEIMICLMEEILRPIKKAGLIRPYQWALEEFYQLGLEVFPDYFCSRWNLIVQFYIDFAGQSEEREKLEAEKIIEQFKKENQLT